MLRARLVLAHEISTSGHTGHGLGTKFATANALQLEPPPLVFPRPLKLQLHIMESDYEATWNGLKLFEGVDRQFLPHSDYPAVLQTRVIPKLALGMYARHGHSPPKFWYGFALYADQMLAYADTLDLPKIAGQSDWGRAHAAAMSLKHSFEEKLGSDAPYLQYRATLDTRAIVMVLAFANNYMTGQTIKALGIRTKTVYRKLLESLQVQPAAEEPSWHLDVEYFFWRRYLDGPEKDLSYLKRPPLSVEEFDRYYPGVRPDGKPIPVLTLPRPAPQPKLSEVSTEFLT